MSNEPVTQAAFEELSKRVDANTKTQSDHESHCNDRQRATHKRIDRLGDEVREDMKEIREDMGEIKDEIRANTAALGVVKDARDSLKKWKYVIIGGAAAAVLGGFILEAVLDKVM